MQFKRLFPAVCAFGIPISINMLGILIFTRQLPLSEYGKLSLAWVSIEFIASILYTWCKMGMMRFYDRGRKSIVTGIQFCIIISLFLFIILITVNLFGNELVIHQQKIISLIIIGVIGRGASYFIQDAQRMAHKSLTRYTLISFFIGFFYYIPAIIVVLLNQNIDVGTILYIQTVGLIAFIFVISIKPIWSLKKHLLIKQAIPVYKSFIGYGLPIAATSIAVGMFTRIDRYVIEHVLGFRELGIYSAAFSLSNMAVSSIFIVLSISTYPEIIRLLNEKKINEAENVYKKNGNIILILIPITIILFCLLNNVICNIFFGQKGSQISYVLPLVLIASYLFNLKSQYFDQIFQFSKTTNTGMFLSMVLGLGHLGVSYLLSYKIGLPGIALSSLLMSLLGIIFTYFFSKRRFRIRFNTGTLIFNVIISAIFIIYLINHYTF